MAIDRMRVLISGASGLIGSSLAPDLERRGHQVWRLVRRAPRTAREISWDPAAGRLDRAALEGFEAVVHLAGESLAAGRWTATRKARIRDSRLKGTGLLCRTLADLEHPPRVLASASAIGIYGDRGDEILAETSTPGLGFLPDLTAEWERAAGPAQVRGIRVVQCRTGLALSPRGGALARLLTPFRLGLGGPIGDGSAWWSWIAIDDLVGVYRDALERDVLRGPVNAVAPGAVRQDEFARVLGRVIQRPSFFRLPAWVLRLVFGQMADEALLASAHVEPGRLGASGFRFRFPDLEGALRHLLAG